MSKLILKRFACVADTDESTPDSPYFLTFVGDIGTHKTETKLTRQGNWHNEVDKGETWTVNDTVADGFGLVPAKTLVLSSMVEEDEGLDISSPEVANIKQKMQDFFDGFSGPAITGSIRTAMKSMFKALIEQKLASTAGDEDDLMSPIRHVGLNGNVGDQPVVSFAGGTGLYKVRYGVE